MANGTFRGSRGERHLPVGAGCAGSGNRGEAASERRPAVPSLRTRLAKPAGHEDRQPPASHEPVGPDRAPAGLPHVREIARERRFWPLRASRVDSPAGPGQIVDSGRLCALPHTVLVVGAWTRPESSGDRLAHQARRRLHRCDERCAGRCLTAVQLGQGVAAPIAVEAAPAAGLRINAQHPMAARPTQRADSHGSPSKP